MSWHLLMLHCISLDSRSNEKLLLDLLKIHTFQVGSDLSSHVYCWVLIANTNTSRQIIIIKHTPWPIRDANHSSVYTGEIRKFLYSALVLIICPNLVDEPMM